MRAYVYLSHIFFYTLGIILFSLYFLDKSLWIDEGYSVITAGEILKKGYPLFDSGYWDGSYMFLHYFQAICLSIFGFSEWSIRLPSLILTLANGYLLYRISSNIFGKWSGVATLLIIAVSHNFWAYGLQGRYYAMLMFFTLLWISQVYRFLSGSRKHDLWILFIVSALGFLFHIFLGVSFFLTLLLIVLYRRKNLSFYGYVLLIILTIVVILVRGSIFSSSWSTSEGISWSFLSHFGYILKYQIFFIENFHFLYSSFFLLPIYFFLEHRHRVFIGVIVTFLVASFLAIANFVPFYAERYIYHLTIFLYIFTPGIFIYIGRSLLTRYEKILYHGAWSVLIACSGFTIFPLGGSFSMRDVFSPEPDFRSAYAYIRKNYESGYTIASAYPHMDQIYLGRSDGYIYIDETGLGISPEKNFYIDAGKNIFTRAPLMRKMTESKEYLGKNNIIILDTLSYNRLKASNLELLTDIEKDYMLRYEKRDHPYFIRVYVSSEK